MKDPLYIVAVRSYNLLIFNCFLSFFCCCLVYVEWKTFSNEMLTTGRLYSYVTIQEYTIQVQMKETQLLKLNIKCNTDNHVLHLILLAISN